MPSDMAKYHPDLWVNDEGENEDALNNNEAEFLKRQIEKSRQNISFSYHKILNTSQGKSLVDNFNNLLKNQLVAIVYNFVDMLSHSRTEMGMIKELAPDESAYRSITKSWLEHSPLLDLLKKISEKKGRLVLGFLFFSFGRSIAVAFLITYGI